MKNERTALIVGGSGGIGSATASCLAQNGWNVYATYHNKKPKTNTDKSKNIIFIRYDIRDEENTTKIVSKIIKEQGGLDAVINTATGSLELKRFEDLNINTFKNDISIHILGAIMLSKEVLPHLRKTDGVLIHLLSAVVEFPSSRMTSYIVAKSGLSGFVKGLGVETAHSTLRVIGIAPSYVETELIQAFPSKLLEIERSKNVNGKFTHPDEIASVIHNVIEHSNQYPTGTIVSLSTQKDIETHSHSA